MVRHTVQATCLALHCAFMSGNLKKTLAVNLFCLVDKLMSCMMTNNINELLCVMGSCTIQALLF